MKYGASMRRLLQFWVPAFLALAPLGVSAADSKAVDPWTSIDLPPVIEQTIDKIHCGPSVKSEEVLGCLQRLNNGLAVATAESEQTILILPRELLIQQPQNYEVLLNSDGQAVFDSGPFVIGKARSSYMKELMKLQLLDKPAATLVLKSLKTRLESALMGTDPSTVRTDLMLKNFLAARPDEMTRKKILAGMFSQIFADHDPYGGLRPSEPSPEVSFNLGIDFVLHQGSFVITKVTPHSPADLKGLKSGDKLVNLNGKPATIDQLIETMEQIGLKTQSTVHMEFEVSAGQTKSVKWDLQNSEVPVVQSYTFDVNNKKIGVLQIATFYSDTVCEQSERHLLKMKIEKVDAVLLDFRDNSGGHLKESACFVSLFVGPGKRLFRQKLLPDGHFYSFIKDTESSSAEGVISNQEKVIDDIPSFQSLMSFR